MTRGTSAVPWYTRKFDELKILFGGLLSFSSTSGGSSLSSRRAFFIHEALQNASLTRITIVTNRWRFYQYSIIVIVDNNIFYFTQLVFNYSLKHRLQVHFKRNKSNYDTEKILTLSIILINQTSINLRKPTRRKYKINPKITASASTVIIWNRRIIMQIG